MSNSAANITIHASTSNITMSEFSNIGILELPVFGFSFLVGLPTNIYVICLIVSRKGNGVAADAFILNLSVCGLFFSVNSLLVLCTKWFVFPNLQALSQFFLALSITGSPVFQCLICVERYLAVVHPVIFLKYKPLRYRVICCAVAWMITLSSCTVCLLSHVMFTLYVYMWFLSSQFLLLFSIKLFCCVAVLRALKQSGPGERKRKEENHMKRRAFIVILITTVNTIITYVPFTVAGLLSAVTEQLFQALWSVSYACFMVAGFLPPVLYLHRLGRLGRLGKLSCFCMCNMLS